MVSESDAAKLEPPQVKVPLIVPVTVAGAFFMDGLDSSIISTSLPQMADSFSVSPPQMSAAITSYLISLAIFIPVSGWIADRFVARQVFCSAIAIFTLGSVFCGISETLLELVLSRVLQGFGGAMMTPVGRLILARVFPKDQLMKAMSYYMLPGMLGPTMGPLVGGFITTNFTWHWNFFINVPIGIIGIALALRYIPDVRMKQPSGFDVTGFIIIALGLGFAQFAIENLGRDTIDNVTEMLLLAGAAAILLGYGFYAARHANPVLDLRMFRSRTFSIAVLSGSVIRAGIATVPFLLPLLLQVGFGLNPFQSGLITFLNTAGAMSMRAWVVHLVRRFGFRQVFVAGVALNSAFMAGFALFDMTTPHLLIAAYLFCFGVLRSAQMIGMSALAYSDVPEEEMSKATSIFALGQRLSQSLGVGISASHVYRGRRADHGARFQNRVHPDRFANGLLGGRVQAAKARRRLAGIGLPGRYRLRTHPGGETDVRSGDPAFRRDCYRHGGASLGGSAALAGFYPLCRHDVHRGL